MTLHAYLHTWTESNNNKPPHCISEWIFSEIYIDLIGILSADMNSVCDCANVKLSAYPLTVYLLYKNANTTTDTSVSPSRSFSHISSFNYLSYWFHSAPGVQTQGHIL